MGPVATLLGALLGSDARAPLVLAPELPIGDAPAQTAEATVSAELVAAAEAPLRIFDRGLPNDVDGWALATVEGVVLRCSEGSAGFGAVRAFADPRAAEALRDGRAVVWEQDDVPVAAVAVPVGRPKAVLGAVVLACDRARLGPAGLALLLETALAVALAIDQARRDESHQHVIGAIGHELRQPLAALVTALDLLQKASGGLRPAPLLVAQRQALQLTRLVDAILDASRAARNRLPMDQKLLDLRAVIVGAVETARPGIEARGQHLAVEVASVPLWCTGDAVRLQQAFVNLLSNANRYTPDGGRIEVAARCEGAEVAIEVRDSGQGVDVAEHERIFAPFVRRSHSGPGMGLGLAISRAIVEGHGGVVTVASGGRGQGSTFTVRLPGVLERIREIQEAAQRTRSETQDVLRRARMLRARGPRPRRDRMEG